MSIKTLGGVTMAVGLAWCTCAGQAAEPGSRDLFSDTWVATDALGRSLPGAAECGPPKMGKFVGIFYFTWLGAHGRDLHDLTKIVAADPANPKYGPQGAFHWWGEPHLGYYLSGDEFVIRKHAQMLTDAGVDVVIFDVTNGFSYEDTILTVCRVYTEIRKTGRATPQIAFIANSGHEKVVQGLYDRFYAKNLYPDLWFRWKGKPLFLTPSDNLGPELKNFFAIRHSWAWSDPNAWFKDGRDKWTWLDHYPQKPGWHDNPTTPEALSVCVAQHPVSNIGRSFHDGQQPPPGLAETDKGICFAEQWKRALEVNPEFVFVTGWNEWVAQRFVTDGGQPFLGNPLPKGGTFFVDQYSREFSRDIEPMRGGHGDNYYCQLVANIRRFKGVRELPKASPARAIRIDGGFNQWKDVGPEYLDDIGDTAHRDNPGWNGAGPYVNTSGRNDFVGMKVARDETHLFFYARTREPITKPDGSCWMMLLLGVDGDPRTGWEGCDFVINRAARNATTGVLEKNIGGWKWEKVADVKMAVAGNQIQIAIPRAALGPAAAKRPLRIDFKWADNVPGSGDILDLIDHGDTAPNGRFAYRYKE